MSIEKLEEFARDGQKNTDELILTDGFPRPKFPARQWFNYLFNMLSLKINELIELDPIARSEIVDDLKTNDATKVASAKTVKELQDNKFDKSDLNNTLTSISTKQALTAAQGKILNDQAFGISQDYVDVTSQRSIGTIYTNGPKGKSIYIQIPSYVSSTPEVIFQKNKAGVWINLGVGGSGTRTVFAVILANAEYKVENTFTKWVESV